MDSQHQVSGGVTVRIFASHRSVLGVKWVPESNSSFYLSMCDDCSLNEAFLEVIMASRLIHQYVENC